MLLQTIRNIIQMKKTEAFLVKHNLDLNIINNLLSQKGFRLLSDHEVAETKKWLENYKLGIELFPIITNDESDYIAVYTEAPLINKVALLQHSNLDFTPKFKDISTVINSIEKGFVTSDNDWENFDNHFDYPDRKNDYQESAIIEYLKKAIDNKEMSNDRYELLTSAIMVLTPYREIESIYEYLDDKNVFVRQKAVSILGDFYQCEPVKEKIRKTLKTINNKILEEKVYSGSLIETKKGFWKSLFK